MNDDSVNDDMLRELQKRTAQLPREIDPPGDAWARIAAHIGDDERETANDVAKTRSPAFWQRPLFLAAAGVTLVVGSSLVTSIVFSRVTPVSPPQAARVSTPGTLAQFTATENDYIATANKLSAALESDSDLSPATVAKLRESIGIIDEAILEARRALAADPANRDLMEMLKTSYGQKVDLLRRTTEMGQS